MKIFQAIIAMISMYSSQALVCIVTIDSVEVPEDFKNKGGAVSVIGASGIGQTYTDKGYVSGGNSEKFNAKDLMVYTDGVLSIRAAVRLMQKDPRRLLAWEDIDVPGCKSGNVKLETHYKVILSDDMKVDFQAVVEAK